MLNKLKPKSEFSRNVLTLMTGTTIAQAIPIAISPILTRIYTPEDFGVLALFVAMTSIFGSIVNGRYELAIMLPKKDEDAINIFALGFIINIAISIFLLIIIILFHENIVRLLDNQEISFWLYVVPFAVFFIGLLNILTYFNNRMKNYKDLAKANVYKSLGSAIVQLSLGVLKSGVTGLISGQLFAQIISNTKLFLNIKQLNLFSKITKLKIMALAKRYRNFPKFSLVANLFNVSSAHLTNIIISTLFTIKTLGFYSLTKRLLVMPSSLIGGEISKVFFQQAMEEKRLNGNAINIFKQTLKKLMFISLPPFILLYFTVEYLFAVIFGDEWIVAGIYAKILLPFFLINFISSPLAVVMSIFEKQKSALIINIIIFLSALGTLYCSYFFHLSFEEYLYLFTAVMFMDYLLFIVYYYCVVQGGKESVWCLR